MTNIRMRALDQLHVSSVQADTIRPGEEFETTTAEAERLAAQGLAERVEEKADPAPANKARKAAPANKARKPKAGK